MISKHICATRPYSKFVLITLAVAGLAGCNPIFEDAKLLIEHNATDEDTGFQGFADAEPWSELEAFGPEGDEILSVEALGKLSNFGLTELFFETSEPPNDEVPIDDVLELLEEGDHTFIADPVSGAPGLRTALFSHDIPAGPELISPEDGSDGWDPDDVVIEWEAVTEDIDELDIEIVGYQVIVEEDAPPLFPQSFARPVFSVHVPADVTSVTVPAEFLEDDTCYKYEVLAIEVTGNQTLSSAEFATGDGCGAEEDPEPDEEPHLTQAKLLIEHNATDEDTGFQGFADGDPWNELVISSPNGKPIVAAEAEGTLVDFGLTEFFFETFEPENDAISIPKVLSRLPEGEYTFTGEMVDGDTSEITATLTHVIPAGPVLLSPADGDVDVDPDNVVVSWQPVTTDLDGSMDINIVGYQVIVELDEEAEFPEGFAQPVFSIFLPATATSVTVSAEFFESGAPYAYEVLAIEESGNQTLSSAAFMTE